jgi:lipopolysaccharide/colanic/teichoic acid biosynthesis glycosyltransferase
MKPESFAAPWPGGPAPRAGTAALKRALDLVVAIMALALLAPLLAILAVLVAWRLGRPVLFRQSRIGWNEQPFTVLKFRTMRNATDASGKLLPDAERLTPFGAWLRSWSLDELPQLWNIVRGDMSFIGPRPLLPAYLPRYSARQRRRHAVRPGLSGLAQVQGRNAISWEQRFELDLAYIERQSLALDLRIALLTVRKLLLREGISQQGHVTMQEFKGANSHG